MHIVITQACQFMHAHSNSVRQVMRKSIKQASQFIHAHSNSVSQGMHMVTKQASRVIHHALSLRVRHNAQSHQAS